MERAEAPVTVALRALVYAMVVMAGLWSMLHVIVVGVAALAAAAAVFVAVKFAHARFRMWLIWAIAIVAVALLFALRSAVYNTVSLARLVETPQPLTLLVDALVWSAIMFLIALTLRTSVVRAPSMAVIEWSVVAIFCADLVSEHREGGVHRPFFLADWALIRGFDPADLLCGLGIVVFALLAVASWREERRRQRRVVWHAAALLILLTMAFAVSSRFRRNIVHPPGAGSDLSKPQGKGQGNGRQMESMDFRDSYASSPQSPPVAVVVFHNDYDPPSGYFYFRQIAFSQLNGTRLVESTQSGFDTDVLADFPGKETIIPGGPTDPAGRSQVRSTVALLATHLRPFALDSAVRVAPAENPDVRRFVRAFEVGSLARVQSYQDLADQHWRSKVTLSADELLHYTATPGDRRYADTARAITLDYLPEAYRTNPVAVAAAISEWLGDIGTYSRRPGHAQAADPTADFLFGDRIGYCVHFAHAAVYLMRSLGFPARVGAGYAAPARRKNSGSSVLLTGRDAHAWPEVYVPGFGWLIVDVAPKRNLDPPTDQPDPDLQRILGEMARGDKTGGKRQTAPAQAMREIKKWASIVFLSMLALCLLVVYAIKLWRRWFPLWAAARSCTRVAYRGGLDRLMDAGIRRRWGESVESYANRLSARSPSFYRLCQANIGRISGANQKVDREEVRALYRQLGREIGRSTSGWRKLAALNPISWMWTR